MPVRAIYYWDCDTKHIVSNDRYRYILFRKIGIDRYFTTLMSRKIGINRPSTILLFQMIGIGT